jgi:hypothetical protein
VHELHKVTFDPNPNPHTHTHTEVGIGIGIGIKIGLGLRILLVLVLYVKDANCRRARTVTGSTYLPNYVLCTQYAVVG